MKQYEIGKVLGMLIIILSLPILLFAWALDCASGDTTKGYIDWVVNDFFDFGWGDEKKKRKGH